MARRQPGGGLGGPLEAQKAHQALVARIEKESKEAFDKLPDFSDSMLTPEGKEHIKETRRLIRAGRVASTLSKAKLDELATRLKAFSDTTRQLADDNKAPESDAEKQQRCMKVYNDCMNDFNCNEDDIVCLCCIPCSVILLRCVAGEIFAGKFAKNIFLAPKQDAANT